MGTPFRDSFESCPRCRVDLVDARDARGCPSCRGIWIEQAVLTEMLVEMLPPLSRTLGRLELEVMQRAGEALPCPTCGEPMAPTEIHDVELDSCPKGHGVWFDIDELRLALVRVSDSDHAPIVPLDEPRRPVARAPHRPPPPNPSPPPAPARIEAAAPRLVFAITAPGAEPYELAIQRTIIKLGKLPSSHIRLDDTASRMHAVIECADSQITIIDLGSTAGTLVNGERITKRRLVPGDRLQLAGTTVELRSVNG